jgi:hypothetical protein
VAVPALFLFEMTYLFSAFTLGTVSPDQMRRFEPTGTLRLNRRESQKGVGGSSGAFSFS